jgi:hypothetical protein
LRRMDQFTLVGLFWVVGRITAAAFATRSANILRVHEFVYCSL